MVFTFAKFLRHVAVTGCAVVAASSAANANNVGARLEGSLLVIAGDNANNQITVAQNAAGDILVSGQAGTLINGRTSVRFPRVQLNAAEIQMGGGDDSVTLRGVRAANDLYVNLGDGADRLVSPAAAPIVVGANLAIEGAGGNDAIRLEKSTIGSDLYVDGGIGVLSTTLTDVAIFLNLTLISDAANDAFVLTRVAAGGDVSIETKEGSDRVTITDLSALFLAVSTDANAFTGADVVRLSGLSIQEDVGIFTGPGNDSVFMVDVAVNKSLTVSADAGNDRVSGADVVVAEDAVFEGGAGTDTFEDFGISGGQKFDVKEFEVLLP